MHTLVLTLMLVLFGLPAAATIDCRTADLATRLLSLQLDLVGNAKEFSSQLSQMAGVLSERSQHIAPWGTDPASDADIRAIGSLIGLSFDAIASDGRQETVLTLLGSERAWTIRRGATLAVLRAACATSTGSRSTTEAALELRDTAPGYARVERSPSGSLAAAPGRTPGPASVPQVAFGSLAIVLSGAVVLRQVLRAQARLRRRRRRYVVNSPMSFRIGSIESTGYLVDINCFGLKMQHEGGIGNQDMVDVLLHERWHSLRIVWKNAHFAGATFVQPLRQAELLKIVTASLPTPNRPPRPVTA